MQGSLLYDNITGCVARPAVGCWLVKKISTLIGYLLTDGLNYLTVKYLAGWHFEKRAAVLKLISFPVYLVCYALHYGIMYVSILYTLYYIQIVFAFAFLSCKKKKKKKTALNRTFSTESYRNWQKSINILKNNELFLKNKQKF